ncbi:MAG: hypothetical protein QM710_08375 [Flavobacterium sp.]
MKIRLIALMLLASGFLHAQDFFKYKISKPYCILNFMETAIGSPGTSSTLKKFIDEKTAADAGFNTLCGELCENNPALQHQQGRVSPIKKPKRINV